ncbi:hypothetical protein ACIOKD_29165 [Streptomyces sp. NPDC087844]|uniref:hypothetical protein n=1 Tax=Streptomyces sp. NPDC087844 TaxID=3365805 RepID=UPI003807E808
MYSRRHINDMLQYDDARRYITMMQGRVLAAVEGFLVDHNVDTQEYQAQITVIQNSGSMSNVQNQPGAFGYSQSQGGLPPDPRTVQQIADELDRLREQLDVDRDQIVDHASCVTFVGMAADQPLDQPEGRTTATALPTRVRDLSAGAGAVVGLGTSVLALIAALQA